MSNESTTKPEMEDIPPEMKEQLANYAEAAAFISTLNKHCFFILEYVNYLNKVIETQQQQLAQLSINLVQTDKQVIETPENGKSAA